MTRKEIRRRYYVKNKEKILVASAKYAKENPDVFRKSSKKYYYKHKHDAENSGSRYRKTARCRYSIYRSSAKRRGLKFNLTLEQFSNLISRPCWYCGRSVRSGLDRVINNNGYTIDNVVPCCLPCNRSKNNMSGADFFVMCYMVARKHEKAMREKASLSKVSPLFRGAFYK